MATIPPQTLLLTVSEALRGLPLDNILPNTIQIQNLSSIALWAPVLAAGALIYVVGESRVFWAFAAILGFGALTPEINQIFFTWWSVPLIGPIPIKELGFDITIRYGTIFGALLVISFMAWAGAALERGKNSSIIRGGGTFLLLIGFGVFIGLALSGSIDRILPLIGLG